MEAVIYNQQGKESGKIRLPEEIFGLEWNADLVHQVVQSMQFSARTPIAHTKNRGDVRGGGKKPWQQKGTGRARHGSIRSPLWVGGGVTHGPRNEKNFERKVNKKMKAKALRVIISRKFKEGEMLFVDNLSLNEAKTNAAKGILECLSKISGFKNLIEKKKNSAMITIDAKSDSIARAFGNIGNITVDEIRNINPVEVLRYKYLVITKPETSLEIIRNRLIK